MSASVPLVVCELVPEFEFVPEVAEVESDLEFERVEELELVVPDVVDDELDLLELLLVLAPSNFESAVP